ncbi:restriction endonuclease subunit S [Brochothrix thermosphacta]|uniref:restriction endonuclease subunit S n=1 Tax=Brochothrix thermosphacta TaxID=2756 RepID=UPI003F96AA8E
MNKKIPELRFKGFTEDWEDRKLGDFLKTPEKVKANIQSKDDLMTLKLNLGGLKSGSNRETLELGSTIYYKRKAGQFIYGKQNFFNGSMAIIPIDLDGKATSGDVPSLGIVGILSEYLYVYVSRENYWKSKESEASGTGSKRIHEKTLQGFDIKVPSTDNEQKKIGTFFKQLDELISLHQRKLDLLKEQKKGYLQKMFPKTGEKNPELRFKGFTDDWEQRKLSDGTNKIGDGLHGTPKYSEDGEVYFVNGNNLVNGQIVIMPETKRVTSNEQSKDDKALNESTILMSINGTIGNLAWYRGENLMLGKSAAYIEVSDFDKKFIYAYLQTRPVKDYYLNSLTGTTIKNLGLKAIRNTNICTPTIDEQAKIGSFFKKLDDTIALHQRKLDLLKEQKKGYLQKMFI